MWEREERLQLLGRDRYGVRLPLILASSRASGGRIAGTSCASTATNGEQVSRLAGLALKAKPSVDFSGYWQRHVQTAN